MDALEPSSDSRRNGALPPPASETRARFDDQELKDVLRAYDIGTVAHSQDFPRGAPESAKVLLRTDRGKYLLKRRPRGKDDPAVVAFSHALQNYLTERAFPLPHLIGTRNGNLSRFRRQDCTYEMFEFIPGERYEPTPQATAESAKMLAVFHRLVRDMPVALAPPPGHYHNSPRARGLLQKIGEELAGSPGAPSAAGRALEVRRLTGALRDAYDEAAAAVSVLGMDEWETQIVHGDWHPGNVLFHEHHIVAVLDYDSARVMPAVTDVANAALQFSIQTGGRSVETWPDGCDEPRFDHFLRGYDLVRRLSRAELRCVPPLMIEALIAESLGPIAAAGHFAQLDGHLFLQTVWRKARWLQQNGPRLLKDWGA